MIAQLIYAYEEYLLLMGVSLGSYQASQASSSYPPGYETSFDSVTSTQYSAPQLNIKFPRLQDPAVFALLLSALTSGASDVSNTAPTEVIDQTDSDDIEPDTKEAIEQLKKEIALFQSIHIDYYQEDLDRIANNQPQKTTLSKARLEESLADSLEEMRLLKYDLAIAGERGKRKLTPEEKEFIKLTAAERLVKIKAEQLDRMKECECTIAKYINPKIFRRNMSDLSADYQDTFSNSTTKWKRSINPDTGNESVAIGEWLYDGPAGKADFDGWIKQFCLLLEMKANYDSLMFSRSKSGMQNGQPRLKGLGEKKFAAFKKQAEKHHEICEAHSPTARCCWIFMTQHAYNLFITLLDDLPTITAIYVPLDKALL